MREAVAKILRPIRASLQTLVEPLDWSARILNNKHNYPPLRLRQRVGSLNDFESSGGEYVAYLKLLCNLKYGDRLLDVGCGCGLMGLQINENPSLAEYTRYYGLDIDQEAIRWCKKHILQAYFKEVTNNCHLPLANNSIDAVLCKSLFTHLLVHETREVLEELNRIMAPGAKCLSTWFLLRLNTPHKGRYVFPFSQGPIAVERPSKPTLAVAYQEGWILGLLDQLGFTHEVYPGSWRGDVRGLSFQDIIVFTKETSSATKKNS